MTEAEYLLKICLAGDKSVGKTSIMYKYTKPPFGSPISVVGAEFQVKFIEIKSEDQEKPTLGRMIIFDPPWTLDLLRKGGDRYVREFFPHTHGVVLVFDLTCPDTLSNLRNWVGVADEQIGRRVPIVLVGNKSDLKEKVVESDIDDLARELNAPYFPVSAKTGSNIEEVFSTVGAMTLNYCRALSKEKEKA